PCSANWPTASAPSAATKPAPIIKLRERNRFFICLLQPGGGDMNWLFPPAAARLHKVQQGASAQKATAHNHLSQNIAGRFVSRSPHQMREISSESVGERDAQFPRFGGMGVDVVHAACGLALEP